MVQLVYHSQKWRIRRISRCWGQSFGRIKTTLQMSDCVTDATLITLRMACVQCAVQGAFILDLCNLIQPLEKPCRSCCDEHQRMLGCVTSGCLFNPIYLFALGTVCYSVCSFSIFDDSIWPKASWAGVFVDLSDCTVIVVSFSYQVIAGVSELALKI